jgi:hypothetical protein
LTAGINNINEAMGEVGQVVTVQHGTVQQLDRYVIGAIGRVESMTSLAEPTR